MKRRPSFASVVALLALFIALGGPAEAAKVVKRVTSRDVKDHSLKVRDLSRGAVKQLQTPRNGSVTAAKLAPDAVTSGAIADRSINAGDIAINSLSGTQIADGSLNAREIARFYGRFQLSDPIPALNHGQCWSGVPAGLAPEQADADISRDVVLVTPDASWQQDQLSLTVKVESTQARRGRFVLAACNAGTGTTTAFKPSFSYAIIGLP
ncbi:MAG TPA: hypothetical protein VH418_16795 [Solirubrobacteraceae bacterium]